MSTAVQTSLADQLGQALALHQQGHVAQAERLYSSILEQDPHCLMALHLLGVLMHQKANPDAALSYFERVLALDPNYVPTHNSRGNTLRVVGRFQEALDSYECALALQPNHVEALNNRGTVLRDLGRIEEALTCYDRVLSLQPTHTLAQYNRGNALFALERFEEAIVCYDRVLQLQPGDANAHHNKGNVLLALERFEAAAASYGQALTLQPDRAEAHCNLGWCLQTLGFVEKAISSYGRALAINPKHVDACHKLGTIQLQLGRFDQAVISYERVLDLEPNHRGALAGLGMTLQQLQRYEDSLAIFARLKECDANSGQAHNNLGFALRNVNRLGEALDSFAHALKLAPDDAMAHWNTGICKLLLGDFKEGWLEHEWRWQTSTLKKIRRHSHVALWLGQESLQGKTILLHAGGEGFGDAIQFCRYASLVKERGATVFMEVQPTLKLLLHTLEGVDQLFAYAEELPPFDYQCPLMSLPLAFETELATIPTPGAYLSADALRVAAWRKKLGPRIKPRVGLVWSGSMSNKSCLNRSLPLADLSRLLTNQAQFFRLQMEIEPADDLVLKSQTNILDFSNQCSDFADTAALLELMDLVITIDTSIAHLAGAMGKRVWILLAYAADWRWLLERSDCPWYPSARLFRQTALRDWPGVVAEVARELNGFLVQSEARGFEKAADSCISL